MDKPIQGLVVREPEDWEGKQGLMMLMKYFLFFKKGLEIAVELGNFNVNWVNWGYRGETFQRSM